MRKVVVMMIRDQDLIHPAAPARKRKRKNQKNGSVTILRMIHQPRRKRRKNRRRIKRKAKRTRRKRRKKINKLGHDLHMPAHCRCLLTDSECDKSLDVQMLIDSVGSLNECSSVWHVCKKI